MIFRHAKGSRGEQAEHQAEKRKARHDKACGEIRKSDETEKYVHRALRFLPVDSRNYPKEKAARLVRACCFDNLPLPHVS